MRRLRDLRRGQLGGLAGDSFYVAIWQGAVSGADLVQIALITHALGLADYGRISLAVGLVLLVGQFFDVRVGTAATTFGARALRDGPASAARVFQFSYLIDLTTGVLAFLVVTGLAPFVGPWLVGEDGTLLVVLYALTLLAATVDDSSVTVLRLLDRFRLVAGYTVALELLRIALVVVALAVWESLVAVVLALLVHRSFTALTNAAAAVVAFRRGTGVNLVRGLGRARQFPERREMIRMVLHTNIVSYARLTQTNLPTVLVGAIAGPTQVGLYKVGMAAGAIVGRLADPPYAALLPRISKLWAAHRGREIRRLVQRATLISVPVMAAALGLVILLQSPILSVLGGSEAKGADTVLVLAALAQAVNGALFWNVGVLYVSGRSNLVARVALAGAATQLLLLPPLVATLDADGAALSYLVSTLGTNLVALYWAGAVLRRTNGEAAPRHQPGPELTAPREI